MYNPIVYTVYIKDDLTNNVELGDVKCDRKCDSCQQFVEETSCITSHATRRKFKINRDITCIYTTSNVIYVAYCTTCGKQGVGSTTSWKPRLANDKSHIKKKIPTYHIVKHFINDCPDKSLCNIKFILVDVVNNVQDLTQKEIDDLLLKKEKFWIGTLVTQHKGLNGTHDWIRNNRCDREPS